MLFKNKKQNRFFLGTLFVLVLSLFAFPSFGQELTECDVFDGFEPNPLPLGESVDAWSVEEADMDHDCDHYYRMLTCDQNWYYYDYMNTWKYAECTDTERASCSLPGPTSDKLDFNGVVIEHITVPPGFTELAHNEATWMYSQEQSTYDETCTELRVLAKCRNGVLTYGNTDEPLDPSYQYMSCEERSLIDCLHPWERFFVNHNDTIHWYTSATSTSTKVCSDLMNQLVCRNGFFEYPEGNIIDFEWALYNTWISSAPNPYYSGCIDLNTLSCEIFWEDLGTTWTIEHGKGVPAFHYRTHDDCYATGVFTTLVCDDGERDGGNPERYNNSICTPGDAPCTKDWDIWGTTWFFSISYLHWARIDTRSLWFSRDCDDYHQELVCNNGEREGGNPDYFVYNDCNPPDWNCWIYREDLWVGEWVDDWNSVVWYSQPLAQLPHYCTGYEAILECVNSEWEGWNPGYFNYSDCENTWWLITYDVDDMLIDLEIVSINLNSNLWLVILESNPAINISIRNNGLADAYATDVVWGFVQCVNTENNQIVFESNPLNVFALPKQTTNIATNLVLDDNRDGNIAETVGTKVIRCSVNPLAHTFDEGTEDNPNDPLYFENNSMNFTFEVAESLGGRFDLTMLTSVKNIERHLDAPEMRLGAEWVKDFVFKKVMDVLVPIVIVLGILLAIFWFYNIMFAEGDDAVKKWVNYLVWWVIGIILIMSSKFIGTVIFENILGSGNVTGLNTVDVAKSLYEQIAFPFIKMAIYLVLGVMFVILVARVFTFIFSGDDTAKKKAQTIIIWNVIGMLIIIGSKQIVEAVYGRKEEVLNKAAQHLGDLGTGIFAHKNIPIIYHIINWVLGLTALVILIIIIWQTFKLLTDPDNPENLKKIAKTIWYIFLGVLIIGAGYVLVNFVIIN